MAKDDSKKEKTYTPAPQVPVALQERYQAILAVMSGTLTVSEAARRLGMSRNHFQTLMHRGLAQMIEGIAPGAPGRPAKPAKEAELEHENEKLRKENARLKEQAQTIDRILSVAGEMLRERATSTRGRERRPKASAKKSDGSDDDPASRLEHVRTLRAAGVRADRAARVMGMSAATARRWLARMRLGECMRAPPSRAAPVTPCAVQAVADRVRALHGVIGADALRHCVGGVSRRQAAAIKKATMTQMERERIAQCTRVHVTAPGVVRGFDAMQVGHHNDKHWLLVASDAAVPYRTSSCAVERYDGQSVARVLARDFDDHGAPLVIRMDRASMHRTPEVRRVLDERGVLVLHGPAYYPRFYGQHERQNRDHRAWLAALGDANGATLAREHERMMHTLNTLWPRRKLDWKTPLEVWSARPPIQEDRAALRKEVDERAQEIVATCRHQRTREDLAMRLAIEQALVQRNYLRCEGGVGR